MPILTIIAYALLAAFAAVDAAAHFTHYKYGPTVSWTIWWLEKRFPVVRLLISAILALGLAHLVLHLV